MIEAIRQKINFLKAAQVNGWFSQWQQSGDVVSPVDRAKIQRETARHYIENLMKVLEEKEGGK